MTGETNKTPKQVHPNTLKALEENREATQFKPGKSGNREGYSLTSELKHALKDKEKRRQFIESTIEGAINREVTPFKEVWDRVEGKSVGEEPVQGDRILNIIVTTEGAKGLMERLLGGEPHGGLIEEGK
ncbi:hypothetical protein LCGC14_0365730 [marine sediment metagenome]|uniref:Uncharacterized protein n=1 Tax=marine sediment metagenome TaxID=412755 RepID=A0A0F9VTZ1_9ZZZZ